MGKNTVVHVMRHGEVFNPAGVLYGRLPGYHLSERGQAMAQLVAEYLQQQGEKITSVIASPLERAQESAAPTAQAFGLPIGVDVDLIEAANHFEGLPVNKDTAIFVKPEHWRAYVNPFRPSWGEPYAQIAARMVRAVRRALAQDEGGNVLLVSHQLPIWMLRSFVEGRRLFHDPRRRECSLASLTTLTFRGHTLVDLAYAEPAAALLAAAADMTPGTSIAAANKGYAAN